VFLGVGDGRQGAEGGDHGVKARVDGLPYFGAGGTRSSCVLGRRDCYVVVGVLLNRAVVLIVAVGIVRSAGVVRVVLLVQTLLLLVPADVLGENMVRAMDEIVKNGIDPEAGFQCHYRLYRMDGGKWRTRGWRGGGRSALGEHAASLLPSGLHGGRSHC
jgi:hypothetical protein